MQNMWSIGLNQQTGGSMDELLLKYNTQGPRYTSYPPATFFHHDFTDVDYKQSVIDSNREKPENISIYIHIPFCPRLCHFCGCTTGIAKGRDHIKRYVSALIREINTVSQLIDKKRQVTQVHWGGGTPNSVPFLFIQEIMNTLRANLAFHPGAEIAMECSPAYLTLDQVDRLAEMGFNRVSLGIQDFHTEVLNAVNRLPSLLPMDQLVRRIRSNGISSINFDLIYGLPKQTPEIFSDSVKQAIDLSPDRLATFSYAHVPWVNKSMELLEDIGLPTTEEKFNLFALAYALLTSNGYQSIGLDHYARPTDNLSVALKEHKLHRNFQGYCTRETTGQVYAFGASGISQMWNAYSQNYKNYQQYIESIECHDFAVEKGYSLTPTELICREAINSVMCNGYLSFSEMASQFGVRLEDVKNTIQFSPEKYSGFIEDGLLTLTADGMEVKTLGMLIVRNIAMTLDPQLKMKQGMYSKTI
jgi:oxygen-independent coproporphyrinogen III oxidase